MTPSERVALLDALEANERAVRTIRAILQADAAPVPSTRPADLLPVATAAQMWGVSKDTARKRAARGAGEKHLGRWFIRPEAIDAAYDDGPCDAR